MIVLDGFNEGGVDFSDGFNRSDGAIGNGWEVFSSQGGDDPTIVSSKVRMELPTTTGGSPRTSMYYKVINSPSPTSLDAIGYNTTCGLDFNFVSNNEVATGLNFRLSPYSDLIDPSIVGRPYFAADIIRQKISLVGSGSNNEKGFTIALDTWYSVEYLLLRSGSTVSIYAKVWERGTAKPAVWDISLLNTNYDKRDDYLFVWHAASTAIDPDSILDIDNVFYREG